MRNIFGISTGLNPSLAVRVIRIDLYVDTIELFVSRRLPPGFQTKARKALGRRFGVDTCRNAEGETVGYRIWINAPCVRAIALLQEMATAKRGSVCRFDLACDFLVKTQEEADIIQRHLTSSLTLRWRSPKKFMHQVESTLYWCHGRSQRNLLLYSDKPARRSPVATPCAHLELRFSGSRSVRRVGVDYPADILTLDLRALFLRCVKCVRFDTDAFLKKLVRENVAHERRRHQRNKRSLSTAGEKYRSRWAARVRGLTKRMFMNTAQFYGREYVPRRTGGVPSDNTTHPPIDRNSPVPSMIDTE